MKRLLIILTLAIAALLAVWVWRRGREANEFTSRRLVHTFGGTNYVACLHSTALGRVENGYVVIVTVHFENPNPYEVLLQRNWFVMIDGDRDYYQPSTSGTQKATIRLPPNGIAERELLSFHVPADSFGGALALLIGDQHWVMLKTPEHYKPDLEIGKFIVFHRRNW